MKKPARKVVKTSAKNLIKPLHKIVNQIKHQFEKRRKKKIVPAKKIVRRRIFKSIGEKPSIAPLPSYIPSFKPAFSTFSYPSSFELSENYGETKLVLLVRDPWWLYAYWEVTPDQEKNVRHELAAKGIQPDKTVLRVYDVTDTEDVQSAHGFFDIELNFLANNWYIDVGKPNRQWVAELGLRTRDGRFFALVRSNKVKTPRYGVSDVIDEEWLLPDELYWKLMGMCGGLDQSKSSLDVRDFLERVLRDNISSDENAQGFSKERQQPGIVK